MSDRMILGTSKINDKERITWREWKEKKEGRYLVVAIFKPNRFPSGSISFDTGEYLVRKSFEPDVIKSVIIKYSNLEADLYINLKKQDDKWVFLLETQENNQEYRYVPTNWGLVRKKNDGIPF